MNHLIERAKTCAVGAHRRIDQRRKYTHQPYEHHLKEVSDHLQRLGADEEMIAAAWLHDVVEDTPTTLDEIRREFGDGVADLVYELTDVSRFQDGNRSMRKAIDREHTARASDRAQIVKLADLTDNCRDICMHDARFGRVYLDEMQAVLDVIRDKTTAAFQQAGKMHAKWSQRLGKQMDQESTLEDVFPPRSIFQEDMRRVVRQTLELLMTRFRAMDLGEPATVNASAINDHQMVSPSAPLTLVVNILTCFDHCYIGNEKGVTHRVRREHFSSPIGKTWLFGIIIVYEKAITQLIRNHWPDEAWKDRLSRGRLEKAETFQQERLRRGEQTDLIDCLQISDKFDILISDRHSLELFSFASSAGMKRVSKDLQALRNSLAHAQDLSDEHWPQIVRLAERIMEITEMVPKTTAADLVSG
jgi:hypothetical protein